MILAPMQGLTEVMFRRVYEECFPGAIALAVSPFFSLTHGNLADATEKIEDVLPENNVGAIPVIPQILGKEPYEFIELGNRLFELGYREVNWNMGCPMRKVAAKHRGSGILPHPDEVRSILDAVVPQLKPSLSVKVRLGLTDREEIFRLIPVLNDFPLRSVTVHPRLGRQQYNGHPDLDTFGRVLPLFKAPVVYNGDILTGADASSIRRRFPQVADIMVGRGVLYRPTLPLDIADPSRDTSDDRALAARFIRRLLQEILSVMPSDQARVRKIKEYWCLVWKALPISEMQARTVLHEEKLTIVEKMICQFLQ
ncbi:MAG: tRNA-dihydrouridine synthase family protein [Bacteroidales bacterium]|nr:tRNA-dihydrouridine synthase family protein [Bacteroidales bacterium]